jgi:septum formation protein
MKIILATTSPYRIAAFKATGIPFESRGSDVDERFDDRPSLPEELVKLLSRMKAEAVAKDCIDSLVIGLDSVVLFQGKILEKPGSKEEAFERLTKMSGNAYEYYTGITMIDTRGRPMVQRVVMTVVQLRHIYSDEIRAYLEQDPEFGTHAHGYNPGRYLSSSFIKHAGGEPSNLKGIPLATMVPMIREATRSR